MKRGGSVYILTNISNDVLYIGVTADLFFRLQEHKNKKYPNSFTSKYIVPNLFIMRISQRSMKLYQEKSN